MNNIPTIPSNTVSKLIAVILILFFGNANATLIEINNAQGSLLYSTGSGVTWTKDANLFKSMAASDPNLVSKVISANPSGVFDPGHGTRTISAIDFDAATGNMNIWGAEGFIGYLNSILYGGYNDWALPSYGACSGYNCTDNAFGYMYYIELGGIANSLISTTHNQEFIKVQNLTDNWFWQGFNSVITASYFRTLDGHTGSSIPENPFTVWAIRGDFSNTVPEPSTVFLFGVGILCILRCHRHSLFI